MKPKLFFVILGLLILCCVLGAGLGILRSVSGGGSEEIPPPWLETAGDLLDRRLEGRDLDAVSSDDCRAALEEGVFTLAEGQACILFVGEASAFSSARQLPLRLEQGGPALVRVEHYGEDQLTAVQELTTAEPQMTVKVFREGGTVEIRCGNMDGSGCRIGVVEE